MRARSLGFAVLLMALVACGGGPSATSPATSGPGPATGGPGAATAGTGATASAAAGTAATAIDLSALDACTLLDMSVVETLTGESGFDAQRSDGGPSGDKCFWGATRPVPQYVEVTVSRTNSLLPFNFDAGAGCTETPVTVAGVQAAGADCTTPQHKVYFRAWASSVQVQVLVNEPKGALLPQDLAQIAQTIFDGLQ
jgi:hypothetical protein